MRWVPGIDGLSDKGRRTRWLAAGSWFTALHDAATLELRDEAADLAGPDVDRAYEVDASGRCRVATRKSQAPKATAASTTAYTPAAATATMRRTSAPAPTS